MFWGQLTVEEIKQKIWDFILRNRNTYQNILERNLKLILKIWEMIEFGEKFRNYGAFWFNKIEY